MAPPCREHPDRPAGWQCQTCERLLCAECTAWVFNEAREHLRMPACLHCRGHAPLLRERRALLAPFASTAASALPWAFTRSSAITAAACTLLVLVGTFIGGGWLFRFVVLSYLFDIARSTANGEDQVPLPEDFRDVLKDMVDPALRLLLSSIWCWGAFSIASLFPSTNTIGFQALLWAFSAFYVPAALLAAATRSPLLQVANPITILGYSVRLGWDSLRLAAFCAVTFASYAMVSALEDRWGGRAAFGLFGLNLLVFIPCTMLTCMLGMATFRAVGLLLRARGDDLGYGPAEAYLDPILGAAEPRGVLPSPSGGAPGNPAGESSPSGDGQRDVEVAARLEPPAQRPGETEQELALGDRGSGPAELARRVVEDDLAGAAAILREGPAEISAVWLSAQGWIALGRHCTAAGDHRLALLALRRATEIAPDGTLAPQAWMLAARIFGEELKDEDRRRRALADLARRFPQSDEGRAAAAWLQQHASTT